MKILNALVWIAGIAWISFVVFAMSGFEFGLSLEFLPTILLFGMVFGCPAYLLIFAITGGKMLPRLKAAGIMLAAGVVLGISCSKMEEFLFLRTAESAGLDRYTQERWWPCDDCTLVYSDGGGWVLD